MRDIQQIKRAKKEDEGHPANQTRKALCRRQDEGQQGKEEALQLTPVKSA
jgi:hypothetical protein